MYESVEVPQPVADAIAKGVNMVRACREYRGYSPEQLSLTSGLTVEEITFIETHTPVKPSDVTRLSRALSQSESLFAPILARKD